jgi:phage-related protein
MSSLIDGIRSSLGNFLSIGKSIVDGLWEGIKNNWGGLVANIKAKFRSLFSNITDLLGINSPSKLWAEGIGGPIAEGIGVGFMREMDNVERSMRTTVAGLLPAMDIGFSAIGMQPAFAGVGQTVAAERQPITINVNPSKPIDYELLTNKVVRKVTEGW